MESPAKTSAADTPQGAALWSRVLNDPQLQDLPFKIETNRYGQIVLSPHKPRHSFSQSRLLRLLTTHMEKHTDQSGEATVELAVATPEGIKVSDVVWISDERRAQIPSNAEASPVMPELCIEVLSASNTEEEISEKRRLCFEGGAREVWTVSPEGEIRFYDASGPISASKFAASFPAQIET